MGTSQDKWYLNTQKNSCIQIGHQFKFFSGQWLQLVHTPPMSVLFLTSKQLWVNEQLELMPLQSRPTMAILLCLKVIKRRDPNTNNMGQYLNSVWQEPELNGSCLQICRSFQFSWFEGGFSLFLENLQPRLIRLRSTHRRAIGNTHAHTVLVRCGCALCSFTFVSMLAFLYPLWGLTLVFLHTSAQASLSAHFACLTFWSYWNFQRQETKLCLKLKNHKNWQNLS